VLHITASKKAVVKSEMVPRIGESVFDENQRCIGQVSDVFGPTVSPYVEIETLDPKDLNKLIDRVLFVSSSPKNEAKKRRK